MDQPKLTRKELLTAAAALGAMIALPGRALAQTTPPKPAPELTVDDLRAAARVAGLTLSDTEFAEILGDVKDWVKGYEALRALKIPNEVAPAMVFRTLPGRKRDLKSGLTVRQSRPTVKEAPLAEEDLAFLPLGDLANLVRRRKITSSQLTQLYLHRLEKYGDRLQAIVTLLGDQALRDAATADREIQAGRYRGPLHGIPTAVKDLFALKGARTTWGAEPYKDQVLDYDAAVVERLRNAGAVICAKTTLGALAMGDKWFGGRTKNPWDPDTGSSGSSAGSAACVSAGLLPYAIGTETLGSIVSPSNQCRVTGLRPTFGRVSRYGAMALSWSMDKVGVIARCAEDTALVLAALAGEDPRDPAAVGRPFHYQPEIDFKKLRIGYLRPIAETGKAVPPMDAEVMRVLRELGAEPVPLNITPAEEGISAILEVEAAAAFDEITRDGRINLMKDSSWGEIFRAARFVPGVELVQAYRARTLLMERFERELGDLDFFIADGRGQHTLLITNLTGHPQILLPWGEDKGVSKSISLVGRLHEEDLLIAAANRIQGRTDFHRRRPDLSKV